MEIQGKNWQLPIKRRRRRDNMAAGDHFPANWSWFTAYIFLIVYPSIQFKSNTNQYEFHSQLLDRLDQALIFPSEISWGFQSDSKSKD